MADNDVPKFEDTHPIDESVPSFDETHPIEAPIQESAPDQWSTAQSLGQGLAEGASLGFLDELSGLAGAGVEKGAELIGKGTGDKRPIADIYKEYRDLQRSRSKQAGEAHPIAHTASEIGGAIVPAVVSGGTSLTAQAALGGAGGLGTSEHDLTQQPLGDIKGTIKDLLLSSGPTGYLPALVSGQMSAKSPIVGAITDTARGSGLGLIGGAAFKKASEFAHPIARKIGQAGQSLFGKSAEKMVKDETENLANNIVNSIKKEKLKIGEAYNTILDANKDKKIDLTNFIKDLKVRAEEFDTSLPEQARDKKAIIDLVLKLTEGPQIEKEITTGFIPGKQTTKNIFKGYRATENIPEGISSKEKLENELRKSIESNKQLGLKSTGEIVPSEDESLLTKILRTSSPEGESATAQTVENIPGTPSYTKVEPINEEIPFSTEIKPTIEKQIVREGGTLTPEAPKTKTLRSNLGTLTYEKNLTNAGQAFSEATYRDLTETLKKQIPGLRLTDEKFTELLNATRKLGIKGNDEDVVRVLSKITSDNQGKEIIVKQALESLDKVNPNLSKMIRNENLNLDQKLEMINKISSIGDFNILNPKSLILGLMKNMGGIRAATGNIVGLTENKLEKSIAGRAIKSSISPAAKAIVNNPWTQSLKNTKPEEKPEPGLNETSDLLQRYRNAQTSAPQNATQSAASLYNTSDDSLKQVASKLSSQPGLNHLGDSLNRAIDTGDVDAKNRAVFLILQNPQSKKLVSGESNE